MLLCSALADIFRSTGWQASLLTDAGLANPTVSLGSASQGLQVQAWVVIVDGNSDGGARAEELKNSVQLAFDSTNPVQGAISLTLGVPNATLVISQPLSVSSFPRPAPLDGGDGGGVEVALVAGICLGVGSAFVVLVGILAGTQILGSRSRIRPSLDKVAMMRHDRSDLSEQNAATQGQGYPRGQGYPSRFGRHVSNVSTSPVGQLHRKAMGSAGGVATPIFNEVSVQCINSEASDRTPRAEHGTKRPSAGLQRNSSQLRPPSPSLRGAMRPSQKRISDHI